MATAQWCLQWCISSKVSFPCLLAESVMQLKKYFIANTCVTIVLVIITVIVACSIIILDASDSGNAAEQIMA